MSNRPVLRVQMCDGKLHKIFIDSLEITNIVKSIDVSYDRQNLHGITMLELKVGIQYENIDLRQGNIKFDE